MLNIELVLTALTLLTAGTALWARWQRRRHPERIDQDPSAWVRHSQSLWPFLLAVLVLRGGVVEPFRIPSESMMPTTQANDFIGVTKYAYDVRLPVTHTTVWKTQGPRRGDVVVFRFPGYWCAVDGQWRRSGDWTCQAPQTPVPQETWIKRVIGVPGDRIEAQGDRLVINGQPVPVDAVTPYPADAPALTQQPGVADRATLSQEHLGAVSHPIAHMTAVVAPPEVPNAHVPAVIPPDCYFVMGDNRENSLDSRWWGCVPRANLVGQARWVLWSPKTGQAFRALH